MCAQVRENGGQRCVCAAPVTFYFSIYSSPRPQHNTGAVVCTEQLAGGFFCDGCSDNSRRARNGGHFCHYCRLTTNAPYLYILHSSAHTHRDTRAHDVRSHVYVCWCHRAWLFARYRLVGDAAGACAREAWHPMAQPRTARDSSDRPTERPTDQPSTPRTERNPENRETTEQTNTNTRNAKKKIAPNNVHTGSSDAHARTKHITCV